ncbi:MAG: hypothetical protein TREMPRED_000095 [Tremellales sp. Tagirdzhanova-0007]|nr:MAG: hypothetical protein TREMPRED_000095 [Tremellales sp. Tagirdzhanova-0007]
MRERTPFPSSLLAQLPNLKLLTTNGSRNYALPFSSSRLPVLIANGVPGGHPYGAATSEHCWALILSACKGVVDGNNRIQLHRAGRIDGTGVVWQGSTNVGLCDKTLGILGLGRLGQRLVPVARAFGLKILTWSPNLTQQRVDMIGQNIVLAPDLKTFMSTADIITLQMVHSPQTHHILGAKELSWMKPSGILVNTSRGGLIDTKALVQTLKDRKIRHAAIDVFEEEPFVAKNPFEGLTNVTLTPHMGYSEDEIIETWYEETVDNVLSWLEDGGSRARAAGRELTADT